MDNEEIRCKELADFLKTRRAKVMPADVGIEECSRRRTPGLRREEVAQLAGIGLTWYTWLEQGRQIHVSSQIVESLARVFKLNKKEQVYLYNLSGQPLPLDAPEYTQSVSPMLQHLLDSLTYSPSIVINARWDVIAWNDAAVIIYGDFNLMQPHQRNIVWAMFTDDKYKNYLTDWEVRAKDLLCRFRLSCSQFTSNANISEFIEDLNAESPEFAEWWAMHEVESSNEIYKQINFPSVGTLDFEVNKLDIPDNPEQKLIIHTPLPGTDTLTKIKKIKNPLT